MFTQLFTIIMTEAFVSWVRLQFQLFLNMIQKTITLLLALVLLNLAASAQNTYQLDTKKSRILWNTAVGRHNGYLLFTSGNLRYTASGEPSTGFFTMDMKSIRATDQPLDSNNKKTSENIQAPDFFDGVKYPTATMQITKITRAGSPNQYTVTGNLTIKGISHPIEFKAAIQTDTRTNAATATADVSIHRVKWGIHPPKQKSADFLSGILEAADIHVNLQLVLTR
jgi:polyisoprenoid-binding protein YceI